MGNNIYSLDSFHDHVSVSLSPDTVAGYKKDLKHFFSFLNKHPSKIKKTDILNYISEQNKRGLTGGCIKSRFFAIKKYYKYLSIFNAFNKNCFIDLFDDIELPKIVLRKQKIFLKDDVKNIVDKFETNSDTFTGLRNLIFILLAATTGARRKEIAMLKVCDIDFSTEHVNFYNTKNKKLRALKLSKSVIEKLERYILMRNEKSKDDSEKLFINIKGFEMSVSRLDTLLRKYAKRYGIDISFHAFRRGFATELSNNKVPIDKISKVLGHSSVSMTASRYVYNDDLDSVVLSYSFDDIKNDECKNVLESISNSDIIKMFLTISNLTNEVARLTKVLSTS